MGSIKVTKDGIRHEYESKHKCPNCGSYNRIFKISGDLEFRLSDNAYFETCNNCNKLIKTTTLVEIVD